MKLIKHTTFGSITTTLDGTLYEITEAGIEVSDDVAEKLRQQFLDTVEVTDVASETASVDEVKSPTETDNTQ